MLWCVCFSRLCFLDLFGPCASDMMGHTVRIRAFCAVLWVGLPRFQPDISDNSISKSSSCVGYPEWSLQPCTMDKNQRLLCWLSAKLYLDFIGNRHMSELVCFPFFDIVHHVWLLRSWCSQCWRFARPGIFMFDSTFALKSLMSQDSKHTKHSYEEHKSIKDCTHFTHIK